MRQMVWPLISSLPLANCANGEVISPLCNMEFLKDLLPLSIVSYLTCPYHLASGCPAQPGIETVPPAVERRALSSGLPGKSCMF